jgi:hypothetical protein
MQMCKQTVTVIRSLHTRPAVHKRVTILIMTVDKICMKISVTSGWYFVHTGARRERLA